MSTKSAIVLAAGEGQRLRASMHDNTPKPLVKLGLKTILHTVIDNLVCADIEDIHIVTGYKAGEVSEEISMLQHMYSARITEVFNKDYARAGTARSLQVALESRFLKSENFLVQMGDHIIHWSDIVRMKDSSRPTAAVAGPGTRSGTETKVVLYSVHGIKYVFGKDYCYCDAGLFTFDFNIFKYLKAKTDLGLVDALRTYTEDHILDWKVLGYPWYNINTKEDLDIACRELYGTTALTGF
jgi:choline kinase